MKRIIPVIALAILTLSGCAAGGSKTAGQQTAIAELAAEYPAIAEGANTPDTSEPPQLMVESIHGETACASVMQRSGYEWENNGECVIACGITPVDAAQTMPSVPRIDRSTLTADPKIQLPEGAKLTSVTAYIDDENFASARFTEDGSIKLISSADITVWSGAGTPDSETCANPDDFSVYEAVVSFPQGKSSYVFSVYDIALSEPPSLLVNAGGPWIKMTKGSWEWTTTEIIDGEEYATDTIACGADPLTAYENGRLPLAVTSGIDSVSVGLPEGAEISYARWYKFDGEGGGELTVSGSAVTLPEDAGQTGFCIGVRFPQGECDYFFGGISEPSE